LQTGNGDNCNAVRHLHFPFPRTISDLCAKLIKCRWLCADKAGALHHTADFAICPETTVTTENVIRIMCPNLACKRVLAVPGHARGKLVRCRSCGINIRIPVLKTKEEPATGQAAPPAAEDAA
jgi:hypothetical protein